jgi:serine/threonine protein kinase
MKSETWQLGCCLYQMATKLDPFEGRNLNETKKNILDFKLNKPQEIVDPMINWIIMKCFERDPNKRLDATGLIKFMDSLEMVYYNDTLSLKEFTQV